MDRSYSYRLLSIYRVPDTVYLSYLFLTLTLKVQLYYSQILHRKLQLSDLPKCTLSESDSTAFEP